MTPNQRQEAVSVAYLEAVAAQCGATVSYSTGDFGIDATVNHIARGGSGLRVSGLRLDLQLKTVTSDADLAVPIRYDLDARAYELLRQPGLVPRLLVLLVLPTDEAAWVTLGDGGLLISRRAFCLSLADAPPSSNRRSVRVTIPPTNRFGPTELVELFRRFGGGRL